MERLASVLVLLLAAAGFDTALAQDQIEIDLLAGGVLPTQNADFSQEYEPSGSVLLNLGFPLEDLPFTVGLELGVDLFTLDREGVVRRAEASSPDIQVVRLEGGNASTFTAAVFGRLALGDPFASHPYAGLSGGISSITSKNRIVQLDGEPIQGIQGVGVTNFGMRVFAGYALSVGETTHLLVEPSYSLGFGTDTRGYVGLRLGFRYMP